MPGHEEVLKGESRMKESEFAKPKCHFTKIHGNASSANTSYSSTPFNLWQTGFVEFDPETRLSLYSCSAHGVKFRLMASIMGLDGTL